MATNRSRRLRKKLRVDEFQEVAFDVQWRFEEGTTEEAMDKLVESFIAEVIDSNGLGYAGGGYLEWDGLVCTEKLGKCTDADRERVKNWLEANGVQDVVVSPLYDLWYGNEVA